MASETSKRVVRIGEVMSERDCSRATVYNDINRGLLPRPVKLNRRVNAWMYTEVQAVNAAIIAGRSQDEIRQLVRQLEAARAKAIA